ncbi:contractile injection system tape measure protein [[Flexibacter] sp. ATCC 35103]|uniref:contractile injection system tape measure protein n=1 Tax=[Flexibacter] sp. ATCC 35103 TaxID=1937528 RepID=UPI0009CC7506|nr:contractile injection system tape measure protein [[Flexibacter] sp. ATCC 35103]OMQ13053.1 hypothetical protein BXU01_00765 [[Flexibacter] sp. ATCC 35103]
MKTSPENKPVKVLVNGEISSKNKINNAGIVVLNSYITLLFERLQLTQNNKFTCLENQKNAVQYLQYIATGSTETQEENLLLNKVLCGLSLTDSVPEKIEPSDENKSLTEGLISAMISHWEAIGKSSINDFRGSWLIRDGLLSELDDKWELVVERRAYDMLISRSPFSFSVIKYPWMNKPLYVKWV